ncbi:aminotransferase class V-fold PLP-dependent enzyme [Ruania zhangjianzhongii]|uniref:aminotransferase class V-fold PLP-dependent enzyme n=1 Tax=Ruania zhangjianzhongii TaxID=2603206 RepID=UPI001AF00294|nr:DegT/DnrJ/EryC1/StrS family aminotransferase [Ruania zhangjianzhongii]
MVTYADLGVRRVINAHNTLTMLGGSIMLPAVRAAMDEAAGQFVDMAELARAASDRVAALTRNEDALIVGSASAGLMLSALAAMTGDDQRRLWQVLEYGAGALGRREIIIQRAHRIPYDNVLTLAGAQVVEVGNAIQTFGWELEAAVTPRTAAILYVAGEHLTEAALPLEEVLEIAQAAPVPVIVDGAAQLPPRENLWRFTQAGAAVALFSGGKEIRGPQASGLMVGKKEFLDAVRMHAFPWQRFGRVAKVGKEETIGLLTALELWLERDLDADLRRAEAVTAQWVRAWSEIDAVDAVRDWPGEAGRPMPRVRLQWPAGSYPPAAAIAEQLAAGTEPIVVFVADPRAIWLNAELVDDADVQTVTRRVTEAFTRAGGAGR